jgi:hypothetical protein
MNDKPTVRQVYALAAALCERAGEAFPETLGEASQLIERLRLEIGHPAPRLSGGRPRRRRGRSRGRRIVIEYGRADDYRRASEVAAELVREMR